MNSDSQATSPDDLELTVDGMPFSVVHDPSQPGAYHYTRLVGGTAGGVAVGYGFTSRRSDSQPQTTEAHVEAIRHFASQVDPVTGYLED